MFDDGDGDADNGVATVMGTGNGLNGSQLAFALHMCRRTCPIVRGRTVSEYEQYKTPGAARFPFAGRFG